MRSCRLRRESTERFAGTASGTLHFTTQGVGRDELIARLTGRGDVRMRNIEFRGWDVNASVAKESRARANRAGRRAKERLRCAIVALFWLGYGSNRGAKLRS